MKFTVLVLFLLSFSLSKAQKDTTLFGEWELIKIEKTTETLYPDSGKYKLKITENLFRFKLEVNWCYYDIWEATGNEITTSESPYNVYSGML